MTNYHFYFGEKKGVINSLLRWLDMDRSVSKSSQEEGHIAICGGSGSGKSQGMVIPTLCYSWSSNFLALDIKGELKPNYDRFNYYRKTKVFSLRGDIGPTYEPFEFIHQDDEDNLVSNIQELVNALLPLLIDDKEPIWILSAREYLTASFLYYYNLKSGFIDAVVNIMTTPPSMLIEEISMSNNEKAKVFINNFSGNENLADSKLLMGITQEITNRLSIFATDPRVQKSLSPSKNQIKWTDLESHSIFLSVPEDRLEQYSPILTMMITQLIRNLERRPEKYSSAGAQKRPVLLMLDEFPRLGKMEVISSAVSTLRSKNVTICLVFQSLAQLDKIYGSETRRILLDNCSYKAILNVSDAESQQYFSNLAGTISVEQWSRNTNYDTSWQVTGYSKQVSKSDRPAIKPHEFATLRDIVLLTPEGLVRIKKGQGY